MGSLRLLPLVIVLAVSEASAGTPPAPRVHRTFLPQASAVGVRDIAPGEIPGAAHPRGTVLLGWSLDHLGPTITEWDLARETVVRQAVLGWPQGTIRIARTAGALHVVGGDGRVTYARLDAATLRVTCGIDLGPGRAGGLASDGALTAVTWHVDRKTDVDLHVATLDASCARQGDMLVSSWKGGMGLAVAGGRVYATVPARPRPWLLSIKPDATVERGVPLELPAEPTMSVAGSGLLLLATNEILEVNPALEVVGRHKVDAPDTALLAVAADGRMLVSSGDVLSPSFAPAGHLPPSETLPIKPAWVGDVPVLLATDRMPLRHVSLAWADPGAPELGALPKGAP